MSTLFSNIVVPVDDSEPALHAAALAMHIAVQEKGRITFVNGVDWVAAVSNLEASLSPADPAPLVDALHTEGRALLARASAQARAAGVACDERLIDGKPVDAILQAVHETGAPLVVMGTHGRSGVARALLGSVTAAVLRSGEVPVLAVHPADKQDRPLRHRHSPQGRDAAPSQGGVSTTLRDFESGITSRGLHFHVSEIHASLVAKLSSSPHYQAVRCRKRIQQPQFGLGTGRPERPLCRVSGLWQEI